MNFNNYNEVEIYIHSVVTRLAKEYPTLSFDLKIIGGITASLVILNKETDRYIGRHIGLGELKWAQVDPLPFILKDMFRELGVDVTI